MSWRDQLQKASFRGVPFFVFSGSGEVGRRNVVHEYPLRDTPMVEDLGRAKRTFSVEAVVVGADYMAQRDALIEALEAFGSGELVHPWRGVKQVCLTSPARISESVEEGGCAKFSLEFTEAGENKLPSARIDTVATLADAVENNQAVAKADFASKWDLSGASKVLDDALASTQGMLDFADDVLGPIQDGMAQLDAVTNKLQTIIGAPNQVFDRALSSLERIKGRLENPTAGFSFFNTSALNRLIGTGSKTVVSPRAAQTSVAQVAPLMTATPVRAAIQPLTPVDQQMQRNRIAIDTMQQTIAVTQAAAALPEMPVAAQADLLAVREKVFAVIDTLMDSASDQQYPALMKLKAAVQQVVTERLPSAAVLQTVAVQQPTSSLALAYRVNGSLDAVDDLIARNELRHPAFINDGKLVEIVRA